MEGTFCVRQRKEKDPSLIPIELPPPSQLFFPFRGSQREELSTLCLDQDMLIHDCIFLELLRSFFFGHPRHLDLTQTGLRPTSLDPSLFPFAQLHFVGS